MKSIDVVVVDDDEDARLMLKLVLERQGCAVRVADDAAQAIVELRRQLPLVLVTDGRLPSLSGAALATHARELASGHSIAVIGISGLSESDALERVSDVFFRKPVEMSLVSDAVHALATHVRERRKVLTRGGR